MQEKITKTFIKKVIPLYGKLFNSSNLNLERVKSISSDHATAEERSEYYNFGITAFKSTAGILAIPTAGIIFGSIGVFRSFSIIIPIILFLFLLLLSIGTAFELISFKIKKYPQVNFTKKHLLNSVIVAIFSTGFFSYLLYVGLNQ